MSCRVGKTEVTKWRMKVYPNAILRRKRANAVINKFLVYPEYLELYKTLKRKNFQDQ